MLNFLYPCKESKNQKYDSLNNTFILFILKIVKLDKLEIFNYFDIWKTQA